MFKQKIVANLQDGTVFQLGELFVTHTGLVTHGLERNINKGNKMSSIVGELNLPDSSSIFMVKIFDRETRKSQNFLFDTETWRKGKEWEKEVYELRETNMNYVLFTELLKQRAIEYQERSEGLRL
ncbi:hypothetical protein [Bacillus toyonensis]|nr:hypothetical protein [Bacillus toyonensis]